MPVRVARRFIDQKSPSREAGSGRVALNNLRITRAEDAEMRLL